MNQQPESEQRVSIWSVPRDRQVWYFVLFNFQVLCLLGLVSWREVKAAAAADGPIDILIAVGASMAGLTILAAAESIFLTDVTPMLFTVIAEKYLNRREKEGEQRGRAEERRRWEEWNARRTAAQKAGGEFVEPPPPPLNSNSAGG